MELGTLWFIVSGVLNHTYHVVFWRDWVSHTGLSEGLTWDLLVNRESLTSIEDVSLVDSPHHCLLPVTFVDLHQACPGGVVVSFPAHPEYIHICFLTLAHSALKAVRKRGERRKRVNDSKPFFLLPPNLWPPKRCIQFIFLKSWLNVIVSICRIMRYPWPWPS